MKIQILVILTVMLFSGCELFEKSCDDYCDGNILQRCESFEGFFSTHNNWYSEDCEKDNKICVEKGYASCEYSLADCAFRNSICIDGKVKDCHESDGEFFITDRETCGYTFDEEFCVEFENDTLCVTPVDKCDSEAEKICVENKTADCYEKDGEFYIRYDVDCGGKECVEIEKYKAYCLDPVETCRPSEGTVCINNQIASCYEKDGRFFASYVDLDCKYYDNAVCIEINNSKAECLNPVDNCDSNAKSVCVGDAVAICYEKEGLFYVYIYYYCHNGPDDECFFDSSSNNARCRNS